MDDLKNIFSAAALLISLFSLYISGRAAWENAFRPAKIVGAFTHLTVWTMSSFKGDQPTGDIVMRYLTPSFWLANVGARRALIEDVRIRFTTEAGDSFSALPVSRVPLEAVESPGLFHEQNKLGLGGPFSGFSLARPDVWKASYAFTTNPAHYEKLRGSVRAEVQIQQSGKRRWVTVLKEQMAFGSHPYHLRGLRFGDAVGSSTNNPVFSEAWEKRRAEKPSS